MKILGINFSHDSSICYIDNGVIQFAIEEEKLSRVKQDFGWPAMAINRLFFEKGIRAQDIDLIALDIEVPRTLSAQEITFRFTKSKNDKFLEYASRIVAYYLKGKREISEATNKNRIEQLLKEKGFTKAKVVYYEHHLSHAASAFYTAPISCDLVITCDGHGGVSSFNYYLPDNGALKLIRSNDYKSSIGLFYSMITKLLGFRPTRHEGKITGLAAYGKSTGLVSEFEKLFCYKNNKLERFPFGDVKDIGYQDKIDKQLTWKELINSRTSASFISLDYAMRGSILLEKLKELTKDFSKEDIAYACQRITEQIIVRDLDMVLKEYFADQKPVSIGLAGGVFSNVRCNQKIYEHTQVKNIFVHPAMGDSGLALGNGILADIESDVNKNKISNYSFTNTYLGPDYSDEVDSFVERLKESSNEFQIIKMQSPSFEIAKILAGNGIVGFWHGRMEWGPRALGSRSIILNTFNKSVNDTLNKRLDRTEFMPFAPSVIDFMMKEYFPNYDSDTPAADYMTITYDTHQKYHDMLQAVVHVDGTARPQVVRIDVNPYYYSIIKEFYELTKCGSIVNTSFNAHEEPIVSSPAVALKALTSGRIDYLVLDQYLLRLSNK